MLISSQSISFATYLYLAITSQSCSIFSSPLTIGSVMGLATTRKTSADVYAQRDAAKWGYMADNTVTRFLSSVLVSQNIQLSLIYHAIWLP
jgi:hypothetical protein